MTKEESDRELIRRVINRDQSALAALYARYARPVYNLALYIMVQQLLAEEVVQDVFFKLWQTPERWDEDITTSLKDWLLAETRILAINRMRQEAGQPPYIHQPMLVNTGNDPGHNSTGDNAQLLRDLLKQLPREQAQVIVLAYFQGMSHSEIAAQLDLPYGTVKSRLRLGMEKLRRLWKETEKSQEG